MAKFLALSVGGLVGSAALFLSPLIAADPAPGMTMAPGAPAKPGPPAVPEDYFSRYGKILSPNDQPLYPFKLTMPAPGFGEVRVPHPEELAMREKLERLATLSDAQIRDELEKWPAFSKMSLGDQGAMLTRIQQFRDFRTKQAQKKAHDLGLLTLNPAQQAKFEQEYWDKRLQMDRQLVQQFGPVMKASEQKLNEDLFREFSSPGMAQAPKPSPPMPPGSIIPASAPMAPGH